MLSSGNTFVKQVPTLFATRLALLGQVGPKLRRYGLRGAVLTVKDHLVRSVYALIFRYVYDRVVG